jgi:hypothetical protein
MRARTVLICLAVLALGVMGFAFDNAWFLILAGLGGCLLLGDNLHAPSRGVPR